MSSDWISVEGGSGGNIACREDFDTLAWRLDYAAEHIRSAQTTVTQAYDAADFDPLAGWGRSSKWPFSWFLASPFQDALMQQEAEPIRAAARAEIDRVRGPAGIGDLPDAIAHLATLVRESAVYYAEAEAQATSLLERWAKTRAGSIAKSKALGPVGELVASTGLLSGGALLTVITSLFQNGRLPTLAEAIRIHHPELRTVAGSVLLPGLKFTAPDSADVARGLTNWATFFRGNDGGDVAVERLAARSDVPVAGVAGITQKVIDVGRGRDNESSKVAVSKIVAPDGSVSWLVSIPGTTDWGMATSSIPSDLDTNIRAVAGETNLVSLAALAAMKDAGVKKGEPVVFAGHSQGGIVSAQLASDPQVVQAVTVAGIVTLGSPVGAMKPPNGQQWLSLEHAQDVVPAAMPAAERGTSHTTVVRDITQAEDPAIRDTASDVMAVHAATTYLDTATIVDQSNKHSIKTWRAASAAILDPDATVTTTEYRITRVEEPKGVKRSKGLKKPR
ncbi:MAG: hypothetical protein LBE08_07295 [Bifidobacteriaceae bacterium]|jgi:hypothetical protein|nr:hypothetical protein [Bifidobacteriaceae bacterium]